MTGKPMRLTRPKGKTFKLRVGPVGVVYYADKAQHLASKRYEVQYDYMYTKCFDAYAFDPAMLPPPVEAPHLKAAIERYGIETHWIPNDVNNVSNHAFQNTVGGKTVLHVNSALAVTARQATNALRSGMQSYSIAPPDRKNFTVDDFHAQMDVITDQVKDAGVPGTLRIINADPSHNLLGNIDEVHDFTKQHKGLGVTFNLTTEALVRNGPSTPAVEKGFWDQDEFRSYLKKHPNTLFVYYALEPAGRGWRVTEYDYKDKDWDDGNMPPLEPFLEAVRLSKQDVTLLLRGMNQEASVGHVLQHCGKLWGFDYPAWVASRKGRINHTPKDPQGMR